MFFLLLLRPRQILKVVAYSCGMPQVAKIIGKSCSSGSGDFREGARSWRQYHSRCLACMVWCIYLPFYFGRKLQASSCFDGMFVTFCRQKISSPAKETDVRSGHWNVVHPESCTNTVHSHCHYSIYALCTCLVHSTWLHDLISGLSANIPSI